MDFGRIEPEELDAGNFKLPPEPAWNKTVLSGKKTKYAVYLGCAKWGRKEWVGKLYPPKTRERDFLQQYVQHYNSIELNATHYKIYGPAGIAKWNAFAEDKDFKFCPKMYQGITHRGSLKGKDFLINEFFRGVLAFGNHLGPIFIQFSESFSPKRKDEIFIFLRSLPTDLQFFVEVRHPDWFNNKIVFSELRSALLSLNMGIVITDTAGRRDCCHMNLTIPKTFIRFVGNSLHPSDYKRCDDWVKRIKYWLDAGLKELYFFMHMHDEAYSPELSQYLAKKLNTSCKLDLKVPVLLS
ncbi:MAG: DUF72 domain-containing protein [Bacteroidota bacterium]|nr:DUF72 domain-containing protein [Bacteroidota bacterium]MDP4211668.1 DUF72 domain-containing protein [Bacteroidota bacterium]MDP4250451.1 DUF72 domain-containing protein [Bacteroidota bacterium]